jgi:hypothetical protein
MSPEFVARVNDSVITRLQLQRTLTSGSIDKANALRDLIDRTLLVQLAIYDEINMHEQARNYMAANAAKIQEDNRTVGLDSNEQERIVEDDLLAEAEMKRITSSFPVRHSEVESLYERRRGDFTTPGTVRFSLILITPTGVPASLDSMLKGRRKDILEARRKAAEARRLVLNGEKFEDVARRFPNVTADDLDKKSIMGTVFTMPIGKVSEVIQTPHGFAVFEVTERNPAHLSSFVEAEMNVTAIVTRQSVREYLDSMRNYSFLEVRDGQVDKTYDDSLSLPVFDPRQGLTFSITLLCIALGSVLAIELILRRQ